MTTIVAVHNEKQVTKLTLHEVDMIYSLARIGDWSGAEIGRKYKISEADVGKVFDNYAELREILKGHQQLPQDPSAELMNKPRKSRSDVRYATRADRQAAYRARLQEKQRAGIEQSSSADETESPLPDVQEPSVTACEVPVTEIGPEEAEPQHSACNGSSDEYYDISESVTLPVAPEACSESEEMQVIEE